MYFENLLYVIIIEFKVTSEAPFLPMTDNLILSLIFIFLLNFQQRSQCGIDITPPLFLNSLPLPFHSSAVTPPLRILTRFSMPHCLTFDRKKCYSIITISSSLNILWH